LLLEERIQLRPFLHFLFPLGSFVGLCYFQYIFEIVEGEDPCAFVENEHGQKIHLHINFRSQSYPRPLSGQGNVLYYEKLVLESNKLALLGHLELVLGLVERVLVDSFGVEENAAFFLEAVVSCGIKVGLPVSEDRYVYFAGAYALIATNDFKLMAVIAKRHVLTHEINFTDDR